MTAPASTSDVSTSAPGLLLPPTDSRQRVSEFLRSLQDEICQGLEVLDGGGTFQEDSWDRPEGGRGAIAGDV